MPVAALTEEQKNTILNNLSALVVRLEHSEVRLRREYAPIIQKQVQLLGWGTSQRVYALMDGEVWDGTSVRNAKAVSHG